MYHLPHLTFEPSCDLAGKNTQFFGQLLKTMETRKLEWNIFSRFGHTGSGETTRKVKLESETHKTEVDTKLS